MKSAIFFHRSGLLLGLGLGLILGFTRPAGAITTNISTVGFSFSPANVTIKTNDTVHWINNGATHDLTSSTGTFGGATNKYNTYDFTFITPGVFNYYCSQHGAPFDPNPNSMNGNVTAVAPPSVTVTNPANNAVLVAPATFAVGADPAAPGFSVTQVQFFSGTTSLGIATTSPYSVNAAGFAAGNYTLSAVVTDSLGQKATNQISIIVNAPPSVLVTNPVNNAVLAAPASFNVGASATDSDGTVAQVDFLVDGGVVGTDSTSPYVASVTALAAGVHTLSAVATDNRGAKATNQISVTVNATPTVGITNPVNQAVFAAPATFTVQAAAADADGTVTNVQFFNGAASIGNVTSAPFQATLNNLTIGTYVLKAVASDNLGATNTSSITVFVTTVTVTSPVRTGGQFQLQLNGLVSGKTNLLQASTDLTTWISIKTNVAAGATLAVSDPNATNAFKFYRVIQLP